MADQPRRNRQAQPAANPPQLDAPAQPQPAQQPLPHRPVAAPFAAPLHPLFARTPPQYKSGTDLDLYLQRFRAFARAANCPIAEQGNLLFSLLDDKALYGVSRTIGQGNVDLEELIAQLRRAEGLNMNSERYVTELRNRKRLKNEPIWDFYLDLHTLAKKAYPANEEMRQGSLRQTFIANLNESYVASRLRELPHLEMEELLDNAIMLYGCQTASAKSVHAVRSSSDLDNPATPEQCYNLAHVTLSQELHDLILDSTSKPYEVATCNLLDQQPAEDFPVPLYEDTCEPHYGYDDPCQDFCLAQENHEDQPLDPIAAPHSLDYSWPCPDSYAEQPGDYNTYPW